MTRTCRICETEKPLEAFQEHNGGRRWQCRPCRNRRSWQQQKLARQNDFVVPDPQADDHPLAPVHPSEERLNRYAACKGIWEWWLEPITGSVDARERIEICNECPVIQECRDVCDSIDQSLGAYLQHGRGAFGIWGGETSAARIERRRAAYAGGQQQAA